MLTERAPVPSVSFPALPPDLYFASTGLPAFPPDPPLSSSGLPEHSHSSSHLALFIPLGTVITVICLILLALLILLIKQKKDELEDTISNTVGLPLWKKDLISSPENLKKWKKGSSNTFHCFTYKEIQKATDDFSTIIGRGGFGTVYKARFHDGLIAAVKRMNVICRHSQQEFGKEVEFLGRLHHRHLVTLKGFCIQKHERFLVYEYMENGSLKEHLQGGDRRPLNWQRRLQIAIDVASALEYLHCYCEPPLCHRDIKSSNILLDEKFMAKVADFGLAHAAPDIASGFLQISTDVCGTPGYMDPEYVVTRRLTDKSDIYSYGVLLLELITARTAVQDHVNLVEWAQRFITMDSNIPQMIDPYLKASYNLEELLSIVGLIKMCTRKEGRLRPTIQQVIRYLHERLDINNADVLQSSALMVSQDTFGKESPSYLNISDEIGSLSSTPSPCTPLSECYLTFRFETTPPSSPNVYQFSS